MLCFVYEKEMNKENFKEIIFSYFIRNKNIKKSNMIKIQFFFSSIHFALPSILTTIPNIGILTTIHLELHFQQVFCKT